MIIDNGVIINDRFRLYIALYDWLRHWLIEYYQIQIDISDYDYQMIDLIIISTV